MALKWQMPTDDWATNFVAGDHVVSEQLIDSVEQANSLLESVCWMMYATGVNNLNTDEDMQTLFYRAIMLCALDDEEWITWETLSAFKGLTTNVPREPDSSFDKRFKDAIYSKMK